MLYLDGAQLYTSCMFLHIYIPLSLNMHANNLLAEPPTRSSLEHSKDDRIKGKMLFIDTEDSMQEWNVGKKKEMLRFFILENFHYLATTCPDGVTATATKCPLFLCRPLLDWETIGPQKCCWCVVIALEEDFFYLQNLRVCVYICVCVASWHEWGWPFGGGWVVGLIRMSRWFAHRVSHQNQPGVGKTGVWVSWS